MVRAISVCRCVGAVWLGSVYGEGEWEQGGMEAGWQTGGITSAVPAVTTTATKATTRIAATQVYRVVKLTKCQRH